MVDLDKIINHASSLMTEEFDRKVNAYTPNGSKNGKQFGGGGDLAALEAQAFGFSSTPSTPSYETTYNSRGKVQSRNSGGNNYNNLPEYMREDFKQNPPVDYDPYATNYVTEQFTPSKPTNYAPQPSQNNGVIDYGYIKYLIEQTIRENVKTLNESSNMNDFRGMRISGNKIQFVDNKGNVYEGVLTLKKRVK